MKAFYVSILTFAIMISVTVYNAIFINDFCEETMNTLVYIDLSKEESVLNDIEEISNKALPLLKLAELTVPREKIETVKNYFDLLVIEAENGEFNEFEKNRKLLLNQLKEIMELEKPRFSNII